MEILHLQFFSYLFLISFLSYFLAGDFSLFNCIFVSLILAFWYLSYFIIPLQFLEKMSSTFLWFFLKLLKKKHEFIFIIIIIIIISNKFFNCPTNSIYWIAPGSPFNFFVYLNKLLLIYYDFWYNHNLINTQYRNLHLVLLLIF